MIAFIEAQRAGLFASRNWLPNVVAGVIVGVVALPLAMAFAIASGVKPEQGLYTAIIAGLFVSVCGGSRVQIAGPTGAFIVILSGIVAQYGIDGLQLATLMAGLILCGLGMARMGAVIRYIPVPVIIGFTAGIGVIIFVGQWRDFFGLPPVPGHYFHEKFSWLLGHLTLLDTTTTLFGLGSLVLILLPRWIPALSRVPGPLLALIVATPMQGVFHFSHVATIGSAFGSIPRGLPSFVWPSWTFDQAITLLAPAFAIAMLGAIESLLSAVVADGMAGTRHDSNAELIGQGLANIFSPLLGGIAATGAIARTATNIRNGGNSPLAGIVHALTLALILVLLAPLAVHIPLTTLAAVLFVVAWDMSEAPRFVGLIRRAPRADVVILWATFLLTVFSDLVVAVNIGMVLSVLHFLRRMAHSVEVIALDGPHLDAEWRDAGLAGSPSGVQVCEVHGPLFFAMADHLERLPVDSRIRFLVLRLSWVPFADITALHALNRLTKGLRSQGVQLLLCGANERVSRKLHRAGFVEAAGEEAIPSSLGQALRYIDRQQRDGRGHRCPTARKQDSIGTDVDVSQQ